MRRTVSFQVIAKEYLFLFGLALICLTLHVSAEPNISSRAVGIVQLQIPAQSQSLVSMPFQSFSNTLEMVLAGQLSGSTNETTADRIFKWDAILSEYKCALKMDGSGNTNIDGRWFSDFATFSNSDLTLSPGEGFFLDNRQNVSEQVYLSGKILLDATNEVILYPGLNLVGYPFSSAGTMPMGQGRWEANTGNTVRVFLETRPYADVFPPEGLLPTITGIKITSTGDLTIATLSIQCAGSMLDVFYKDMTATNVFDSEHDWLIAESNILVSSRETIEWKDQGGGDRPPVNEVFSRVYLLGRADIDSDGNGIPDAREIFVLGTRTFQQQNEAVSSSGSVAPETQNLGISTNSSDGTTSNAVPFQPNIILGKIIYVDRNIGRDDLSGRTAVIVGSDGPKRTIGAGLAQATAMQGGGTVVIKSGMYGTDLNIAGKDVSVVIDGDVDLTRGSPESTPIQQPGTNVSGVATNRM